MMLGARQARDERARTSIPGRLIEHAVTVHGLGERGCVGVLRQLEGVEAGTLQEKELVAQDLAGRTQLPAKGVTLAQEPRLAVGAAVAEIWKHEGNERDPVEIGRELSDLAVVGPHDAGW